MIRHEVTFYYDCSIASIKEYYNGKLVKHETFTEKGEPLYLFREEEDGIFWYEYVYENGVLVWFWNSNGHQVTYTENGKPETMSSIQLYCNWLATKLINND